LSPVSVSKATSSNETSIAKSRIAGVFQGSWPLWQPLASAAADGPIGQNNCKDQACACCTVTDNPVWQRDWKCGKRMTNHYADKPDAQPDRNHEANMFWQTDGL